MVQEVLDVIQDIARTGATLLIVTHEMSFARKVADRVVFMEQGRIVKSRRPRRFHEPRHGPRPGLHPYRHARTRRHVRLSLPHESCPCATTHARPRNQIRPQLRPGPDPAPTQPASPAPAARHGAGADGLADPAAGEHGDAPRRRAALLVRRIRQPDRGRHPRAASLSLARGETRYGENLGRLSAPRLVPLPERAARRGHRHGTHRRQRIRGIGHHAGRAAAARAGRPRRRHHSALAQPDRDSSHPRRPHPALPAVGNGRPMDAGRAGLLQALRPGTRLLLLNSPNPRAGPSRPRTSRPSCGIAAGMASGFSATTSTNACSTTPRWRQRRPSSGTARPMTASSRSTVSPRPGP